MTHDGEVGVARWGPPRPLCWRWALTEIAPLVPGETWSDVEVSQDSL